MRVPTGTTDRYIYFVAVDATDLKTAETGLATFTVYGSKNGAAAAAFTTPTVNETSSANMPGVYELLVDEQTSLTAGNDTEELCLYITHAGMAPVTRTIELYRPETTEGNTLDVTATGAAGVDWGNVENQSTSVTLANTGILSISGDVGGNVTGSVGSISGVTFPSNFSDLSIDVTTGRVDVSKIEGSDATDQINAACDASFVTYGLDHLVSTSVTGTDIADNSIFARLVSKSATADWDDFVNTTDSLQALRDQGDSAWITATGFATQANVATEISDFFTVDTIAEVSGIPAATSTLADKIGWMFAVSRNKITTTSSAQNVRNDADSGNIASSTLSDNGTTFTRGEFA